MQFYFIHWIVFLAKRTQDPLPPSVAASRQWIELASYACVCVCVCVWVSEFVCEVVCECMWERENGGNSIEQVHEDFMLLLYVQHVHISPPTWATEFLLLNQDYKWNKSVKKNYVLHLVT